MPPPLEILGQSSPSAVDILFMPLMPPEQFDQLDGDSPNGVLAANESNGAGWKWNLGLDTVYQAICH